MLKRKSQNYTKEANHEIFSSHIHKSSAWRLRTWSYAYPKPVASQVRGFIYRNGVLVKTSCVFLALILYLVFPWSYFMQQSSRIYSIERRVLQERPVDLKATAIIMNHDRPQLIQNHSSLIPTLLQHPAITEVLLLHSNPDTAFEYEGVTNVNATKANQDMGLAIRFLYARDAINDWILVVDDDMECSSNAIDEALQAVHAGYHIVGKYGRVYSYWTAPLRHGYHTYNVRGQVEVILTKFMVLSKVVCAEFVKHMSLMNDIVETARPLWNGEDIFVNLVSNHYYGNLEPPYKNFAIPELDVWEVKTRNLGSVSGNMDRIRPWNVGPSTFFRALYKAQLHSTYRGRMWATAKHRLATIKTTPV